jgi:hypothetical protein
VQAADLRDRNDLAQRATLDGPAQRRVLLQAEVRARRVVVLDVLPQESQEVGLVEDDHVVRELAA